jgi:iron(III) transport system permease protein
VQGLPGLVIALSLVFFAVRLAYPLYQSPTLLVIAYAVMFFPMALISLRASLVQLPRRFFDTARSLGCSPMSALLRVTIIAVVPGIFMSRWLDPRRSSSRGAVVRGLIRGITREGRP